MRVAYICLDPGVPVFGVKGCSIHVQQVLRAMQQCGADVELFATRLGGPPPTDLSSVPVHHLSAGSAGGAEQRERALLKINNRIARVLDSEGPFDLVYERHALFSWKAMRWAREVRIPGVLEVNAPLVEEQRRHRRLVRCREAETGVSRAFEAAGLIVSVSEEVAAYCRRLGASVDKTQVVTNGVDTKAFCPQTEPILKRTRFTVGFVGSLKPWHAVDDLLQAVAWIAGADIKLRLVILGDGPERPHLERKVEELGIRSHVEFVGPVPHREVPHWLTSFDVAVAPYPALSEFYFSPLKIYEYMACGLPVVASRSGEMAQLVEHQLNGLLYRPGDVSELADHLAELASRPQLRRALGAAARQSVAQEHTWQVKVDRILQLAARDSFASTCQEDVA